jgi:hypothetical protein
MSRWPGPGRRGPGRSGRRAGSAHDRSRSAPTRPLARTRASSPRAGARSPPGRRPVRVVAHASRMRRRRRTPRAPVQAVRLPADRPRRDPPPGRAYPPSSRSAALPSGDRPTSTHPRQRCRSAPRRGRRCAQQPSARRARRSIATNAEVCAQQGCGRAAVSETDNFSDVGSRSRGQAAIQADSDQTTAWDDERQRNLGVLLLDERGSGTGADRPPADSSVSSAAEADRVSARVPSSRAQQECETPTGLGRPAARSGARRRAAWDPEDLTERLEHLLLALADALTSDA